MISKFSKEQKKKFDKSDYGATDPVYPNFDLEIKKFNTIRDSRTDNLYDYFDIWFDRLSRIHGVYLAGGSLRNLLGGHDEIADIDIFFRDQEALDAAMKIMSEYEGSEDGCWYIAFQCPAKELITYKSAIECLSYGENPTEKQYREQKKVQFVTKSFYPTPEQLISTFDFTPSCACLYDDVLYAHADWITHVKKKVLGLNFISYPVASIFRMMKYKDKGYFIPPDTVLNMVIQINNEELDEDRLALYID